MGSREAFWEMIPDTRRGYFNASIFNFYLTAELSCKRPRRSGDVIFMTSSWIFPAPRKLSALEQRYRAGAIFCLKSTNNKIHDWSASIKFETTESET